MALPTSAMIAEILLTLARFGPIKIYTWMRRANFNHDEIFQGLAGRRLSDGMLKSQSGLLISIVSAMAALAIGPLANAQDPPHVIELRPAPGSVSSEPPASVVVTFDLPILDSSINSRTFRLIRSGGDGIFNDSNEVRVGNRFAFSLVAPRTAAFDLADVDFPDDTYELRIGADIDAINTSDAESLSLQISGELLPPTQLFEQIKADLGAIRRFSPEMTSIVNRWWPLGAITLYFTIEGFDRYNEGRFDELDSLNALYGPVEISDGSDRTIRLRFDLPYNPVLLASIYEALDGVSGARPFTIVGGGPYIELTLTATRFGVMRTYRFSLGFGDCPAGCIFRHFWSFSVNDGAVEFLGEEGDPLEGTPLVTVVVNEDGITLDGEFSGDFPTGDGTAGGDFVATFTIDRNLNAVPASLWTQY